MECSSSCKPHSTSQTKQYENPDLWYPNQQRSALHCLDKRCVSVWWYYDQLMRDIPGFQHNETQSTTRTNQPGKQPRWGVPQKQLQRPQYTALQENIADAAAIQRQLALHHYAPEPNEDMDDLDSWDIHYDGLMPLEHRQQVADLLQEIKRIKQRNVSKIYTDKQQRRGDATRTRRKYRCFSSTSKNHGHLATGRRTTPTIRTKYIATSNESRKCATPMHGCAKWKFPPPSMGLLVTAPFKHFTFNPGPRTTSVISHSH